MSRRENEDLSLFKIPRDHFLVLLGLFQQAQSVADRLAVDKILACLA